MRLSDLNPSWHRCYDDEKDPKRHHPLPTIKMSFTCPKCGSPGIISIFVTTQLPNQNKQHWHSDTLPTGRSWFESATIDPSIRLPLKQHGPHRPDCGAHFTITNGEIIFDERYHENHSFLRTQ